MQQQKKVKTSSDNSSRTTVPPTGFHLSRSNSDEEIERLFIEFMHKRGWQNLPDQAQRQMLAYSPAKKWTLVNQDK
jgi:cytokinesis protein